MELPPQLEPSRCPASCEIGEEGEALRSATLGARKIASCRSAWVSRTLTETAPAEVPIEQDPHRRGGSLGGSTDWAPTMRRAYAKQARKSASSSQS